MRRIKAMLMWLLDVMVAVFIGPVDAGKRTRNIRQMASRRGAYALAFAGVVVLAAVVYTIATRSGA